MSPLLSLWGLGAREPEGRGAEKGLELCAQLAWAVLADACDVGCCLPRKEF